MENPVVKNDEKVATQSQVGAISPSAVGFKISDLSDEQLYKKCVECGMNAKEWVRKFAAMLPEVEKRGLHRKRGFTSIYEFAKKLAGMSDFTVDRILRLVKRIADKPILLRQFESGKQSWNKIETVSYIATKETDEDLAQKVAVLPYRALSAYVSQKRAESESVCTDELKNENISGQDLGGGIRDEMQNRDFGFAQGVGGFQSGFEKMFGGNNDALINYQDVGKEERYKVFLFHASIDVQFKLRLFKQRLEKERKQSFSWNEVFEILLRKLEERKNENDVRNVLKNHGVGGNIFIKNGAEGKNMSEVENNGSSINQDKKSESVSSRHIPVELKRQILAKYQYKCGFPKCNFPCFVLHHTKRFVLFRRHDAESIVPLCKKHHDLVHGGCIENEEDVPEKWVLKKVASDADDIIVDKHTGEVLDTKEKVDAVVMKYKMKNVK